MSRTSSRSVPDAAEPVPAPLRIDDATAALVAYAGASAAQLRQLLPGMHPGIARRVARIAAQLETAVGLTERATDEMTNTTTDDVDIARTVRCSICSAGAGCNCIGARGRQLARSVHVSRLEAARSDETSSR